MMTILILGELSQATHPIFSSITDTVTHCYSLWERSTRGSESFSKGSTRKTQIPCHSVWPYCLICCSGDVAKVPLHPLHHHNQVGPFISRGLASPCLHLQAGSVSLPKGLNHGQGLRQKMLWKDCSWTYILLIIYLYNKICKAFICLPSLSGSTDLLFPEAKYYL